MLDPKQGHGNTFLQMCLVMAKTVLEIWDGKPWERMQAKEVDEMAVNQAVWKPWASGVSISSLILSLFGLQMTSDGWKLTLLNDTNTQKQPGKRVVSRQAGEACDRDINFPFLLGFAPLSSLI